ncbi:MAG: hypothetical protein PHW52_04430 [Candidatus Pacebacteria bacterium]|nr:hypothetical protein [Candidatus Paceibacterota bacterium]
MITKELLDYIIYQLSHAQSWEKVKQDLLNNGWTVDILDEAYKQIADEHPEFNLKALMTSPVIEAKKVDDYPKDMNDVVITGNAPGEKIRIGDVSVDDVVFKEQDVANNPAIEKSPIDPLAFFPAENNVQAKPKDSYMIDTGSAAEAKDVDNAIKPISINVTKVGPASKAISKQPENKTVNPELQKKPIEKNAQPIASGVKPQTKKGAPVLLIILLLLLVSVVGGSSFAYFNYLAPEKVSSKVMAQLKNLKSVEFASNGELNLSLSESVRNQLKEGAKSIEASGVRTDDLINSHMNLIINTNGKFDFKNKDDYMLDSSLNISQTNDLDQKYSLSLNEKVYNNSLYLNVEDFSVPESSMIPSVMKEYFGRWIRVMGSENGMNISADMARVMEPSFNSMDNIDGFIFETKGVEKIDEAYCLKMKVSYDRQKLKESILSILSKNGADENTVKYFNENYDSFYDNYLSKMNVLIWAGILDSNIYKMNIVYANQTDLGDLQGTMTVSLKNHNNIIGIIPPDGHVELDELMKALSSLFVTNNNNFDDNEIRSAMEQARLIADKYKVDNKSYKGLEFSNDMNRVINEDVNKWGDVKAVFVNSEDKYCLSKKLVNDPNNWCIDSSSYIANGICSKEELKCVQDNGSTITPGLPVQNPATPNTPVVTPPATPPVSPSDANGEKKELINQLKKRFEDQKTSKGTYLGVVSSTTGMELVKQINEGEGKQVVIATSKEKYCTMKEFSDGSIYCVDNTGFAESGNGCSKESIKCNIIAK